MVGKAAYGAFIGLNLKSEYEVYAYTNTILLTISAPCTCEIINNGVTQKTNIGPKLPNCGFGLKIGPFLQSYGQLHEHLLDLFQKWF